MSKQFGELISHSLAPYRKFLLRNIRENVKAIEDMGFSDEVKETMHWNCLEGTLPFYYYAFILQLEEDHINKLILIAKKSKKSETEIIRKLLVDFIDNYNSKPIGKPNKETIAEEKVNLSMIVGVQKEILLFILNECNDLGSKVTRPLTLEYLSNSLKRSEGTIKTSLKRLEKKGYLIRAGFKNGRGGWTRYKLPDNY